MAVINTIQKELHEDNNPYDQPDNTYRDSRNGVIMHIDGDNYVWKNIKGTALSFPLGVNDPVFAWCWIRNRLFVITLNELGLPENQWLKITEIEFDNNGLGTPTVRYAGSNAILQFSFQHPIRKMIGFYENDDIQRIYFTDNNNQIRTINLGRNIKLGEDIDGKERFLNFYPTIINPYGKFELLSTIESGNLMSGTYFYTWQYYTKDGYYSDWSPLTNPVTLTGAIQSGNTPDAYQEHEGQAPNVNSYRGIKIRLSGLDDEYDSIRIAAFYSNDLNSVEPGVIIYDNDVDEPIERVHTGSENAGTVTISEISHVTVFVERCKDIAIIKDQMVLANIKERDELDVTNTNPEGKNDRMECDVYPIQSNIILDNLKNPDLDYIAGKKALYASVKRAYASTEFYAGFWYKAIGGQIRYETSDSVEHTVLEDEFFCPSEHIKGFDINTGPIFEIVQAQPYIVIQKYRKANAVLPVVLTEGLWINQGWVFDAYPLNGEYGDYKSSIISHYMKGYPQAEKVRLGVTFFDETGRPFFTRWLKNTNVHIDGYNSGGDTAIPKRDTSSWKLYERSDLSGSESLLVGKVTGLHVSGIDITHIKDRVKGMMIVRAPIIRKYAGSGIILPLTYNNGEQKAYGAKKFTRLYANASNSFEPNTYAFYCPEDLFKLSGFSIQPGDYLVNNMYAKAMQSNPGSPNWQGFGMLEKNNESAPGFLYKFYEHKDFTLAENLNGSLTPFPVRHEIKYYTEFLLGTADEEIYYNPDNILRKYSDRAVEHNTGVDTHRTSHTNHCIVVLDIDYGAGTDIKGLDDAINDNDNAYTLVCLVEKPIDNSYGGSEEAAISNTRYISCGHYQEINQSVLDDIENNGTFIFNDIHIYGGDTFVGLFSHCMYLQNRDNNEQAKSYNLSFVIPLESRINLAMRSGDHIAKNRSWDDNNPTGIRRYITQASNRWEQQNYNDGYSSDNIDAYYLPLPFNSSKQSIFDTRVRYSLKKTYGEYMDSFRRYNALHYIDLPSIHGSINNIQTNRNHLIYWQPDMIGSIPVSERALQPNEFGEPIQIGISGAFDRYDELTTHIGNSNQFGLVDSPFGFYWYDAKRKLFLHLPLNMQLSRESIIKGVNTFFTSIPAYAYKPEYDNPLFEHGMFGGYDPQNEVVYYTFILPDNFRQTIGINVKTGAMIGYFPDFYANMYINDKDRFFGIENSKGYLHNAGPYNLFYDRTSSSSITIVIKSPDQLEKLYDTFEVLGGNVFFTKVKFENSSQEIEEYVLNNRNYKFRNNRWYGNFPKVNRQRFVDGYLKVTFTVEGYDVQAKFNKMFSHLTIMY